MSEKQVNIKITASTKDFDNAIKKAQKQIEDLADVIDSLGSSKFGDKLGEQFDGLIKALKKAEDQIKDMQETLDDLGKAKLNKTEEGLEDIAKAGDKAKETLEKTTESAEGINKVKFNKIEEQFKDIVDSGKDVNEKIEDILDLLDKVDKQDLNGLENEFDQVKDALEKISTETRNSTEDMEQRFREVTEEVSDFINKLDDVDYVHFNEFSDVLQDANRRLEELTEQQNKFNREVGDLDSSGIDRYADAMNKINGTDGRVSINTDSSNKGKNKGGLLSNISDDLMSGAVAGKVMANSLDKVVDRLDDVNEKMEHLADISNDDIDKSIDELGEEYKEAESALEKLGEEYEKHNKELEQSSKIYNELKTVIDDYEKEEQELIDTYNKANDAAKKYKSQIEDLYKFKEQWDKQPERLERDKRIEEIIAELDELNKKYDENGAKCSAAENKYAELNETLNELKKRYEEAAKAALELDKAGDEAGAGRLAEEWDRLGKEIEDVNKQLKEAEDACDAFDDEGSDIWGRIEALEEEKAALLEVRKERKKAMEELTTARDGSSLKDLRIGMEEELEKLEKAAEEAKQAFEDLGDSAKGEEYAQAQAALWAYGQDIGKTVKSLEQLNNVMNENKKVIVDNNKVAQDHADDFDKQYKAYEKLSQKVKAYLEDEKNGILLREKVAKSFKEVADSMEAVYKDSSKLNNADLITKTLAEAAEYVKDLNLVSTENLQADLNRLGEIIEDKTEKIKRFKELNKEFGSDASKAAAGLDKQAKDIRDWANSADFAIEAADKLTHAWGDLSAAGEDHLKIRERSKYIDDFGRTLEENIAHIKNYYHELETLDDIYKECTDKQRATIDDYKMWEKNKEKLLEYNRAITEYMRTLRDSGGEIDAKFLDELGNFSPQKFIDNFEKMGASSIVLSKQINAVKIELIESIKQYKENAEAAKENAEQAVRNAKAALDEAKANQKNADSQEEYVEATERVKKAQQELAEAKKKAKNYDDETLKNLKDQIQEYNRLAAAMREIGMAAQDLGKADIAKFNTSLASMLDNLGTFENDLPKTFADLKEDIKAIFMDMDGFDLGGVFDGLKDIGAGILSQLPTKLKVAAAAAVALGAALKECAEIGINQFTRGMETVGNALSGIVNVARDVGQEIRDAFENITGMQMDFSSMMEIPVEFESMMAEVGAIAGATGEAFDELEAKARELGATTRYSAYEVAEAMKYMGMAGWTNKEILAGLESVLNLATVANMDLGQASDFVTDGLTALGLEAGDAAYMVNVLAAASTSSNTSVAQMQRAFTNCASVLGTLSQELEDPKEALKDLSIALGLMADKGVKGAKAGTAMKNLMANLSAPTKKQLAYIKQFNLEGAQQAIVNGNLIDGIKQMKAALKGLSPQQQNAVITTIAGKEALAGISALLNTTEEDMAELEAAINGCDGAAQEMADTMDLTLKGALKGLASAMQETLLQIFDKTEKGIKDVVKQFTEFFHILNGFSDFNGLKGLEGAFAFLENASQGWGKAIADGLTNAIGAIDNFLNSESFDNLLQVGTNIINGIADGIREAADNGTLDSAISTAIGKIATWFSENLETIIDVGKEVIDAISKGISENGPAIGEAIRAVMDLQTEIDKAVAKEKWKLIGDNLISFIIEGIQSKVEVFVAALSGFFSTGVTEAIGKLGEFFTSTGSTMLFDPVMSLGKKIGEWLRDAILEHFNLDGVFSSIGDKISGVLPWNKDKKESSGSSKGSTGKAPTIDTSKSPIDIINSNLSSGKNKTDATAASIGEGISSNITSKLETMDATQLQALNTEMQNLQTTVTALGQGMSASFTVIQDSARTAFMGLTNIIRNQMLNCTNIIRNQCVNWYNIINNQVTNARNVLTSQFLSMAAVARTQMVNISNIIRNQAMAWANIIANQAKNARDALTRQFMSMAAVARTQMNKVASAVSSSMNNIVASTSRGISMNVNVNPYTNTGGASVASADALYAANSASTFSLGRNMSALASGASSAVSSGNTASSGGGGRSSNNGIRLEIPVMLDGKEVARATASYVNEELKTITNRENRKRGAK